MQAFMWAFKPTDVVDIRYFPWQDQQNIIVRTRERGKSKDEPEEALIQNRPVIEHSEPTAARININ